MYQLCSSCQQPTNSCSCNKSKSDNVSYTGPNLSCIGVDTNDNLTLVIEKIGASVCNPILLPGTTNQIPKFTTPTTIGDSNIADNGTNVLIAVPVSIIGSATANSFIKVGGTISQFLKADGSLDSNSYAIISGTGVVKSTAGVITYIADNSTNWDTAFAERNRWDGGATSLVAATGRTSLGATTVGGNIFTSTNPSAITFLRANADNSVTWLDAVAFRTAIGAGTGSILGTANKMVKFATATTVGDSNIAESATGGRILINGITDNGTTTFQLAGNGRTTPLVNTTGFTIDMPAVDNFPTIGVPDAFRTITRGHNGTTLAEVSGHYATFSGNHNAGFVVVSNDSDPILENSVGFDVRFRTDSTTNTAIRVRKGAFTNVLFSVSDQGVTTATQYRLTSLNTAPASSSAAGTLGEIRITNGFIYVCVATNTWQRSALTTF